MDGIGGTQTKSIESFFLNKKNIEVVKSLIEILKIENFKNLNKKGKFSNKNLMFTGGFEKMSRSEAKALTEEKGGKVLGTISKKLNILVVGDVDGSDNRLNRFFELRFVQIFRES